MTSIPARVAATVVTIALASAGCSGSSTNGKPSSSTPVSGTINVFAAASLTEAFTTLGKQFEAEHHGVKVSFNFGASSALAEQINQGAPSDVFASASTKNMDAVVSAGGASSPTPFAKNVMEIATPPSNPAHVATLTDLTKKGVKVAVCQSQVPCGATAEKVFTNAHIAVKPVTEEIDVKSVLAKVELDEVDAGIVYVTDVRAAGEKVKGITIPGNVNASTTYPIAALTKANNPTVAQAFVAYVLSSAGSTVLTGYGFEKP